MYRTTTTSICFVLYDMYSFSFFFLLLLSDFNSATFYSQGFSLFMKVQSFLRKKRISRQRISGNPFSQRPPRSARRMITHTRPPSNNSFTGRPYLMKVFSYQANSTPAQSACFPCHLYPLLLAQIHCSDHSCHIAKRCLFQSESFLERRHHTFLYHFF